MDLNRSPCAWYAHLSSRLLELGFVTPKSDNSLFIYRQGFVVIYFLVYVDDIVHTGSHPYALTHLIHVLGSDFSTKDLGDLHYFHGIECRQMPFGLIPSQCKYIWTYLRKPA